MEVMKTIWIQNLYFVKECDIFGTLSFENNNWSNRGEIFIY